MLNYQDSIFVDLLPFDMILLKLFINAFGVKRTSSELTFVDRRQKLYVDTASSSIFIDHWSLVAEESFP